MTKLAGIALGSGVELSPAVRTGAVDGSTRTVPVPASLRLRAGEWIEVRSLEEILSTLDESAALDGLPFMPEMVQYCGKRFRVHKSAHKTCDTIEHYVIRRMQDAVHLEGLRCDGEGHAGCQAGCLLFWKEAWLKRCDGAAGAEVPSAHEPTLASSSVISKDHQAILHRATRAPQVDGADDERYRCQATELLKATSEVRRRDRWNPRFYLRDLTSGNVSPRDFVRYGLLAMLNAFMLRWRGRRYPRVCGLAGKQTPTGELNLRSGELVRIRSKSEIMQTLNAGQRNRGLWFDVEMLPHCGSSKQVLRRIERIVDERTGKLISFRQPCVILDDVTCSGNLSTYRMFCPRAVYPYWREVWLERDERPVASESPGSHPQESD
jgi:hypothetical protein